MPAFITYMEVSVNSEGVTPKELTETLRTFGWKPIYGRYDFAYKWDPKWDRNTQEFFNHIHNTHTTLKGCNVNYSLKTYEQGTENFPVTWCD